MENNHSPLRHWLLSLVSCRHISATSFFLLFSCLLSLVATPALAASIFIETPKQSFAVNESFVAQVRIDTENQSINAVEGALKFDSNYLEVVEILDGNSLLNFWLDRPRLEGERIVFSGMTPGGFRGEKMLLFSVIFKTRSVGNFSITAENIKAFVNDGNATPAISKGNPLSIIVDSELEIGPLEFIDNVPPEPFEIIISNDPSLYEGKYFAVFAAQDKGSGIGGYKIREGFFGKYKDAESPYLLESQNPKKPIAVIAYDKFGNERKGAVNTVSIKWNIVVILVIILILIFSIRRARWKRQNR